MTLRRSVHRTTSRRWTHGTSTEERAFCGRWRWEPSAQSCQSSTADEREQCNAATTRRPSAAERWHRRRGRRPVVWPVATRWTRRRRRRQQRRLGLRQVWDYGRERPSHFRSNRNDVTTHRGHWRYPVQTKLDRHQVVGVACLSVAASEQPLCLDNSISVILPSSFFLVLRLSLAFVKLSHWSVDVEWQQDRSELKSFVFGKSLKVS